LEFSNTYEDKTTKQNVTHKMPFIMTGLEPNVSPISFFTS